MHRLAVLVMMIPLNAPAAPSPSSTAVKLPLEARDLLPDTPLKTRWKCNVEKPGTFRATITYDVKLDRWVVMTATTAAGTSVSYSTFADGKLRRYLVDSSGAFTQYVADGVDCRGAGHGCDDRIVAWESADGMLRSSETFSRGNLERLWSARSDDGGKTWTTLYTAKCSR